MHDTNPKPRPLLWPCPGRTGRRARAARMAVWLAVATSGVGTARAQPPAPDGCPVFHCSSEALGVIHATLIDAPTVVTANAALGKLRFQGCSGDGARLGCLFSRDDAAGGEQGTLKVLDATSLAPLWGSASAPGSYDPLASATSGQVPTHFADGTLAAGDAAAEALYDAQGAVIASVALSGTGNNFGLTLLSPGRGVVSQGDGLLTLIDLDTWTVLDTLALRDPAGGRASLVSPSSGSAGTLYAIARNARADRGLLFAVSLDAGGGSLSTRASFAFDGRSEASPVVLPPALTGRTDRLVLVHAPGLDGDLQQRLIALADDGGDVLQPTWAVSLEAPLPVTPTVDLSSRTLFLSHRDDRGLYRHDIASGALTQVYDLQAETGLAGHLVLNGHLVAVHDGVRSTLLLSAAVDSAPSGNGQYVMAFAPDSTPRLRWIERIAARADKYTQAWNLGPSSQGSASCPIVVGSRSGITRLCDF